MFLALTWHKHKPLKDYPSCISPKDYPNLESLQWWTYECTFSTDSTLCLSIFARLFACLLLLPKYLFFIESPILSLCPFSYEGFVLFLTIIKNAFYIRVIANSHSTSLCMHTLVFYVSTFI